MKKFNRLNCVFLSISEWPGKVTAQYYIVIVPLQEYHFEQLSALKILSLTILDRRIQYLVDIIMRKKHIEARRMDSFKLPVFFILKHQHYKAESDTTYLGQEREMRLMKITAEISS